MDTTRGVDVGGHGPHLGNKLRVNFARIFGDSELNKRKRIMIKELTAANPGSQDSNFLTRFSQSTMVQFKACLWKQNLPYWRGLYYNAVRIFFTTIITILFGSIFWNMERNKRPNKMYKM
jgi:hypothetical protein